jgi:hypothetical protein
MLNRSLRQKFILSIVFILAIWLASMAYIEIRVSRRQLVESYELEAIRAADIVEWMVRQSMLSHRRSDIQKFLQRIRAQRDIDDTWLPVADFVEKPVDFDVLRNKVSALLHGAEPGSSKADKETQS